MPAAAPPPPRRHQAELNATPMLDVLLVLLVVFMLVAMRVRHTIDAQLPLSCASAGALCEGDEEVVLEVLPGPAYLLNREPVPRDALHARLAEVYAGRPSKLIQVTGRAGATYQQVIDAMDVARGSGVRVIGLLPRDSLLSR